jgi:hypothetical protein
VSVSPFIGEYNPIEDVPVASVATAWDNPVDGSTVILVINEALYFGDRMEHSLLCPNQMRCNGVVVNDVPPMFSPNQPHSIIIPGRLEIPLKMRGVMSYIDTCKPTADEILKCEHYELTSARPWNPNELELDLREIGQTEAVIEDQANSFMHHVVRQEPPELSISSVIRDISSITHTSLSDGLSFHEADVILHGMAYREAMAVRSKARSSVITKEVLAKRWYIGIEPAARTLQATTQQGMRYVEGPLERRLRTSQAHMRFPSLNIVTYTDTMFSGKRSVRGFTCAQVFTDGYNFSRVYPMRAKGDAPHALMLFIHEVGVPKTLLSDLALEETRGEWAKIVKQYHIDHRTTEARTPWQNRAEAEIRELKKMVRRVLKQVKAPAELWCFAIKWVARIRSLTAHDTMLLNTRISEERITGRTPDISEYAHHSWFDWVWYHDESTFPEPNLLVGKWLGVASKVGQAMTYWLLTSKGTVIARSSVTHFTEDNMRDPSLIKEQEQFLSKV